MFKHLKSLVLTLCAALSLAVPAYSAGTLPLAMAQQIDINGQPLANCQVTFFVAGIPATLQNNYADFGLTQAQSNPLSCDQTGRIPMFWLADGLIHVRLTDSFGTPIIDTTMQVLGPSSGGGGGGGTVDPTSIMSTGDIKARYGTGPLTGFVRCNALTIGNAGSGATERANADTQNLFVYLYNTDPNLVVSGGRTGNALNDFNAGKQMTLVDMRGRAPVGLGDMGNSATTALLSTYFGNSPTTLGAAGGNQGAALAASNLPPHTHNGSGSGTTGNNNADHTHTGAGTTSAEQQTHAHSYQSNNINSGGGAAFSVLVPIGTGGGAFFSTTESAQHNHTYSFTTSGASANHQHPFSYAFTTDAGPGSSTPFPVVTPSMVMTFYMKL